MRTNVSLSEVNTYTDQLVKKNGKCEWLWHHIYVCLTQN